MFASFVTIQDTVKNIVMLLSIIFRIWQANANNPNNQPVAQLATKQTRTDRSVVAGSHSVDVTTEEEIKYLGASPCSQC